MTLILKTAPVTSIVSLEEVKKHVNMLNDDNDELLKGYIASAATYLDGSNGILGRAVRTQSWELRINGFPSDSYCYSRNDVMGIDIPLPPLQTIDSFKYVDTDGSLTDVDIDDYQLIENGNFPATLIPAFDSCWPVARFEPNAVRIEFTAGFADDSPILASIKLAVKQIISLWYENREASVEANLSDLPHGTRALLAPLRIRTF